MAEKALATGMNRIEFKILQDCENRLLQRREITVEFPGGAGRVTRKQATEAVASKLNVDPARVLPVSFIGATGSKNVSCVLYVYEDLERAKRHLPEHVFLRNLEKEDRKKIIDERRKAKASLKLSAKK